MLKYTECKITSSRGRWCLNPARISQVVSSRVESAPGWLDPEPHCLDFKPNSHSPLWWKCYPCGGPPIVCISALSRVAGAEYSYWVDPGKPALHRASQWQTMTFPTLEALWAWRLFKEWEAWLQTTEFTSKLLSLGLCFPDDQTA